jgi:hypothetical protein
VAASGSYTSGTKGGSKMDFTLPDDLADLLATIDEFIELEIRPL